MLCHIDGLFATDQSHCSSAYKADMSLSILFFPETKYDMMCDRIDINFVNCSQFEAYLLPPKLNLEERGRGG